MSRIEWNKVTWYSKLAAVVLFVGVFVLGLYLGAEYNDATRADRVLTIVVPQNMATSTKPVGTSTPVTHPATTTSSVHKNEKKLSVYLTAYTYWDNTPPGSAEISHPIVHQLAGGSGTFVDPITLAVGHNLSSGTDVLDYPAGTKFYMPYLKKYFIVEDTCGDGTHPETLPCHVGYQGHPWFDLWIDGANGTKDTSNECAASITEIHAVIQNPISTYTVVAGSVYNNGCAAQFGDTPEISI